MEEETNERLGYKVANLAYMYLGLE